MAAGNSGKLWRWGVPLAVFFLIWFWPTPESLVASAGAVNAVKAWHMLAIFAATIVGILTSPVPSGVLMILALAVCYFTHTLTLGQTLSGFSSGAVWMIWSAIILGVGFIKSGLGRRIAYFLLSKIGNSTLGVAYALGFADLVMAPAMPSVTARSGGIILPIAKAINEVMDSEPGEKGKRIGDFLIMVCFQFAPITGALFLTGMAANPLCATLAKSGLGVELTWAGWLWAALVPALLCFFVMPYAAYKMLDPTLKKTPEAKVMGAQELVKMGPMTRQEKLVLVGFIGALVGWGSTMWTGFNANAIGIALAAYLLVSGALTWNDVLGEKSAWDTVVWFSAIIALAGGLTKLGFITWMVTGFAAGVSGVSWLVAFLILGFAYIYLHYAFATATGHVAAMYVPFGAVAIGAGAPPMMVAICFGIFTNFMWSITEYAGGPGPVYFSTGYFSRPRFYKINFILVTLNIIIVFASGMLWWKAIGLY